MNKRHMYMAPNERYRIRFTMKADGEDAEIMVYSDISNDKWWGDEATPKDFDAELKKAVKAGVKRLNIRINSPGGEVFAAVAMRSMVINAGIDVVNVTIEGLCASAATLFCTIPGAHVAIMEGSEFMIHNPMSIAIGNAADMEHEAEHLRKMEDTFAEMYAGRTGQEMETIKNWMAEETWFTAKEACEAGFCDEVVAGMAAVACVSARDMALMKSMYKSIPDQVTVEAATEETAEEAEETNVSNGTPVAGAPSEINNSEERRNPQMELTNLTEDQLREGNPALYAQVCQGAIAAERERLSDIDALTVPGYEEMAEQAKTAGTSVIDFQKQIVAAMKQKGADYLQKRQEETASAQQVAGGSPDENQKTEEQNIADVAKEIAGYAESYGHNPDRSMF